MGHLLKMASRTAAIVVVAGLLHGCGGGGGGNGNGGFAGIGNTGGSSADNTLPQSALQTVAGLIAYVGQLTNSSSDTASPVVLGDATLPTSDTDGPSPLP